MGRIYLMDRHCLTFRELTDIPHLLIALVRHAQLVLAHFNLSVRVATRFLLLKYVHFVNFLDLLFLLELSFRRRDATVRANAASATFATACTGPQAADDQGTDD